MALLIFCIGLLVIAMAFGWIDSGHSQIHPPLWGLAFAGTVLMIGGVLTFLVGRKGMDALRNLAAWLFVLFLVMTCNWIAFSHGEGIFSVLVGGQAGMPLGRIVFGGVALLLDGMLIWSLFRMLRGKPAFNKPNNRS